jgi:hypothetical protein
VDAQHALLELFVARGDAARVAAATKRLSRTDSYSCDALNALLPWLVLSILRAVPSLSPLAVRVEGEAEGGGSEVDSVFARATVNCADTLRLLGEPLWAMHVLLHLPRGSEDDATDRAIRCVLEQEWETIRQMPGGLVEAEHFLCEERNMPRAWLPTL